ncbi:MAG: DUF3631 domain-containing protein [Acidobacteria bacterium]|nr:DUF3631 domain-containing protein [Acidobacteriota bacterium]
MISLVTFRSDSNFRFPMQTDSSFNFDGNPLGSPSLAFYVNQFMDAASARGLVFPDSPTADGHIHRTPISGRNGMDGAYLLRPGPIPSGGYQNHADGHGWVRWRADLGRSLTPEEESAFYTQAEADRIQFEADEAAHRSAAAARARKLWESATPFGSHPYLTTKKVVSHGLRVRGETLLIPLYDADGEITSLQFINPKGGKLFLKHGRKKGCSFRIGEVTPGPIYIAEGYATAASVHEATEGCVVVAFDAGNLESVAKAIRSKYPGNEIVLCADDDLSEGNPGLTLASATARAVGGRMVQPCWGDRRSEKATDFNDMALDQGLEAVRACIEGTTHEPPPETTADVVKRLAALAPLEYEQVRVQEAAALGIRVSALDKAVENERPIGQATNHKPLVFQEIEPWPEPVDGASLLEEIRQAFNRFVVADPAVGIAIALWVAFTWLITWFKVAPLLVFSSPEPRCGKTQAIDFINRLAYRALVASNISPAAVYRVIEAFCPTLLIDEADAFMKENEELRGIINSGHTRQTSYVWRCVGEDQDPVPFSTWAAKAIAGIGHLSATIVDRSILVVLRRKLQSERSERLRHADPRLFSDLASKLARFAQDAGPFLAEARPSLPDELHDRAQDNWESLLAIADLAGGDWPSLARNAALKLSQDGAVSPSTSIELLADIRGAFLAKKVEKITTEDLIKELASDSSKAWGEYSHGKPITARQLGKRLGEFGIHSKSIKVGGRSPKGYVRVEFLEVFDRYLPPVEGIPAPPPAPTKPQSETPGCGKVAEADPATTQGDLVAEDSATSDPVATAGPAPDLGGCGTADATTGPVEAPGTPGAAPRKGRPF